MTCPEPPVPRPTLWAPMTFVAPWDTKDKPDPQGHRLFSTIITSNAYPLRRRTTVTGRAVYSHRDCSCTKCHHTLSHASSRSPVGRHSQPAASVRAQPPRHLGPARATRQGAEKHKARLSRADLPLLRPTLAARHVPLLLLPQPVFTEPIRGRGKKENRTALKPENGNTVNVRKLLTVLSFQNHLTGVC